MPGLAELDLTASTPWAKCYCLSPCYYLYTKVDRTPSPPHTRARAHTLTHIYTKLVAHKSNSAQGFTVSFYQEILAHAPALSSPPQSFNHTHPHARTHTHTHTHNRDEE